METPNVRKTRLMMLSDYADETAFAADADCPQGTSLLAL
jgi:hypothetical protein